MDYRDIRTVIVALSKYLWTSPYAIGPLDGNSLHGYTAARIVKIWNCFSSV